MTKFENKITPTFTRSNDKENSEISQYKITFPKKIMENHDQNQWKVVLDRDDLTITWEPLDDKIKNSKQNFEKIASLKQTVDELVQENSRLSSVLDEYKEMLETSEKARMEKINEQEEIIETLREKLKKYERLQKVFGK